MILALGLWIQLVGRKCLSLLHGVVCPYSVPQRTDGHPLGLFGKPQPSGWAWCPQRKETHPVLIIWGPGCALLESSISGSMVSLSTLVSAFDETWGLRILGHQIAFLMGRRGGAWEEAHLLCTLSWGRKAPSSCKWAFLLISYLFIHFSRGLSLRP